MIAVTPSSVSLTGIGPSCFPLSPTTASLTGIRTSGSVEQLEPSRCFSILFRGGWTLDLMMLADNNKRDEILDALDFILKTYQQQKQRVSNDVLLLRYYWLDAVSEKVRRSWKH